MTTRRKFLERSALGFGSAFLLPSLLTSCTDHRIDPSNPTPKPPLLGDGDDSFDWNELAKSAVTLGLGEIPVIGGFVSDLVGIVWPGSGNGPWDQVRAQTEALINQQLDDLVYQQVTGNLGGLKSVITDYKQQVDLKADIKTVWFNAYTDFDQYQYNFQVSKYEVLLLPLFAQFANLYLGLLRDAVKYGTSWGMTDGEIQVYATKLTNKLWEFVNYAGNTYSLGRNKVESNTAEDDKQNEPFKSINAYDRQMTMLVLDYMDSWPYYDITQYPNGAQNPDTTPINLFTNVIYSDPYGNTWKPNTFNTNNPIVLPSPATQFPTQISIWGGQRLDAVQLTYPAGGGPGGVTQTARMGDSNGGSTQNPNGGIFNVIPGLAILQVGVTYSYAQTQPLDQLINTLQFMYTVNSSNFTSDRFGGDTGNLTSGWIGYTGYALSSIYIHGASASYPNTSADCIVFGFMRRRQH